MRHVGIAGIRDIDGYHCEFPRIYTIGRDDFSIGPAARGNTTKNAVSRLGIRSYKQDSLNGRTRHEANVVARFPPRGDRPPLVRGQSDRRLRGIGPLPSSRWPRSWVRRPTALAEFVGPTWGGLLSASLGNAPEIIIGFFALRQGLVAVVKSSLDRVDHRQPPARPGTSR